MTAEFTEPDQLPLIQETDKIASGTEGNLREDINKLAVAAQAALSGVASDVSAVAEDLETNAVKKSDPGAPVSVASGWPYRFRNTFMQILGGWRPDSMFEALRGIAFGSAFIRSSNSIYAFAIKDKDGRVGELSLLKDGTVPRPTIVRWLERVGIFGASTAVHLTVRPSPGPGEFASPMLANASIADASAFKPYIINVHPGVYRDMNWIVKAHVTVRGTMRDRCVLLGEMPDDSTNEQVVQASTVWLQDTARLENLTVRLRNGRYPVHSESNGEIKDYHHQIVNCEIDNQGNQGIIDYRNANGLSLVGLVSGDPAWGYGASSGGVETFENSTLNSKATVWAIHDREDWTAPSRHYIKSCRLTAKDPESVFQVESLGSGVDSTVTVTDSEVGALFVSHRDAPWITQKAENQVADHYQIRVSISGLDRIGFRSTARGRALRFVSASTGAVSTVRVSGVAAAVLMGDDPTIRDGGGGLRGYAYGVWDMSGILVGLAQNIAVNNKLGRRLGNLSAAPITMSVFVDGGPAQTVTFDADYTAMENDAVLAVINGQLTGVTADTYLVVQNEHYPEFPDRQRTLINTGAAGIPRFAAVKQGANGRSVELMGTADPVSAFLGVALVPIAPGKSGRILTSGMLETAGTASVSSQLLGVNTSLAVGAPIYLSNTTPGAFATSGTRQVAVGHFPGWARF